MSALWVSGLKAAIFLLLLARRSWSLRKRRSPSRCASRSTTVWEESLSRRWANPPRSASTPALLIALPLIWLFIHSSLSLASSRSVWRPTWTEPRYPIHSCTIKPRAAPDKRTSAHLNPRLLNTHFHTQAVKCSLPLITASVLPWLQQLFPWKYLTNPNEHFCVLHLK